MDTQPPVPVSNNIPIVPPPPTLSSSPAKNRPLFIIFGLFLLITGIIIGLFFEINWRNKTKPKACTQEAKICPDGSSVHRTGPNCEFTSCPVSLPNLSPTSYPSISITPVSDLTLNWKSYENKENNFSFKYPDDDGISLSTSDKDGDFPYGLTLRKEDPTAFGLYLTQEVPFFELTIYVTSKSPDSIINLPPISAELAEGFKTKTINIDGVTARAYYGEIHALSTFYTERVFAEKNSRTYFISYSTNQDVNRPLFNQILSTFRFSGLNNSDPTSGWNTYTSKNGILSFKYPPSYLLDEKGTNDIDLIKYKEDVKAKPTPLQPTLPFISEEDYLIGIQISFDPVDPNETVQSYVDNQIPSTKEVAGVFDISNKTNINIDGVEGIRYLWNQPGRIDGSGENVHFIYQGKSIFVQKYPSVTELQNEFDQILSTFKFL